MFEGFLEQDAEAPNYRAIYPSYRYPRRPLISRVVSGIRHRLNNQAAAPASIIQDNSDPTEQAFSSIEQHRASSFSQFLEGNSDAGRRFQNLRRAHLVLQDDIESTLPPEGALVEPQPPRRFCNYTVLGCTHPLCSCRSTTPPPSSSSSHVP